MQKQGIYGKVEANLVLGENISQTASFVMTGAADVGIVALSLAVSPNMKEKGRYVEIATSEYPAIDQACVILSASKNKDLARRFLSYIKTPAVAEILRHYGFGIPER